MRKGGVRKSEMDVGLSTRNLIAEEVCKDRWRIGGKVVLSVKEHRQGNRLVRGGIEETSETRRGVRSHSELRRI